MSEGRIIYAGPILKVEPFFPSLGYKCPEHMDVADFLQQVSNRDRSQLYDPSPELVETLRMLKILPLSSRKVNGKNESKTSSNHCCLLCGKTVEKEHVGMSKFQVFDKTDPIWPRWENMFLDVMHPV